MLRHKDATARSILFYLGDGNAVKILSSFLLEILSNDEIKSLLSEEDCEGQNVFHWYVSETENQSIIRTLSDFIKSMMNSCDQKKLFTIKNQNTFHLALAAKNQNKEMFSTIQKWLKGVFTDNEIKSMIQEEDSNGNNILLLSCQTRNADVILLWDLLEVVKDVFDTKELRKFLTSSNNQGRNCLLVSVKFRDLAFIETLFDFIKDNLSIEEQRDMILKHDNDGNYIFRSASDRGEQEEILPFVLEFAEEILSENQIQEQMLGLPPVE